MGLGSPHDFGRRITVHRGTFSAGGWAWYIGGLLLLASVVGPLRAVVAPTPDQVRMGFDDVLLTAGAALVLGLLVLIVPVLRWRQQVELFENGFVWTGLTGTRSIGRDQVRGVELIRHRSKMGVRTEIKVTLTDGRRLSVSGVDQPEQLANVIGTFGRPAPAAVAPTPGWSAPAGGWRPPGT
ncbi:MAG TPA: hypothetical protein VMI54_01720 [Polyangiaceae bacterium]|nr:hypothetical protein [Polyangiaceae bacterium]